MKVRVSYTLDVHPNYRRAINLYFGKPGLADREAVKHWLWMHGRSMDDDLMFEFWTAVGQGKEPMPKDATPEEIASLNNDDRGREDDD